MIEQGGVLGGVAVLVAATAWGIKTCGPELRCWMQMLWARSDAKKPASTPD
jgi:hypothetical protein